MTCSEEAEAQLAEIELLLSMFPSEEELQVDELSHAELRAYVEGSAHTPPSSRPQFNIKLKVENLAVSVVSITLLCTYPADYPKVLPDITARCSELSRSQQMLLHSNLNTYLSENCSGDVCILSAVQWINENAQAYISKCAPVRDPKKENVSMQSKETFTRLWIYSHHIYNKMKRKNILEWAKELNLSGFSMPGKPGIVCVEGLQSACDEFWARVKVLTWKRIMIRHREDVPLENSSMEERTDSLRKFTGFHEAIFDPHGTRGNHMDLGQLYQFLNDKGCADIFQMYFGIEGR
ncbi:RWD domain-containing protein 2B [Rhinichthys klamathensis goyatoka]|uniref:RWD domain-containing protein 2B n=1 Tax=Rhinichthys klamathensis goyatoka TaxID=3034132 RepID=UPI0024B49E1C|nr:RWD domain-containing protein 2B [Rhinichthys klamathensis goyatoka]